MDSHPVTPPQPSDSTLIDDGKRQRPAGPTSDAESSASGGTPAAGSSTGKLAGFNENEQTVISTDTPTPTALIPIGLHPRELGELLAGQQLGELQLKEFIGGGGMGAVFRAVDTKLQRNVAVKILATHQSGDEEMARRFELEAKSAARLDHPHIARVHYVGEDLGLRYIVFEYIDGTNLRDVVTNTGPLPLPEAISYTLQIADALSHAWQREVTHRDIKPSNILITADSQAKLVDMGLARVHQLDQTDHDLTASGVTLGTFDYISPEQARNPKSADTRSDIYSLGCTLYFMLTGQPPFSGGTALQKLLQHHNDDPPSLRQFRRDVPESVCGLVALMLAKRVENRFQNPVELVAALAAIAEPIGIGRASVPLPTVWTDSTRQETWLLRNLPWVLPVLLLPIGVFLIEHRFGDPGQPRENRDSAPPAASHPKPGPAGVSPPPGALDGIDYDSAVGESPSQTPTSDVARELSIDEMPRMKAAIGPQDRGAEKPATGRRTLISIPTQEVTDPLPPAPANADSVKR